MRDAEAELGIAEPVAMTGYVFSEAFATGHRKTLDRFLEITKAAYEIMERSDAEWDALRPVIKAEDEATFAVLRDRTRAGIPRRSLANEIADARKLFKTLVELGGPELVGPAKELDPNLYYKPATNAE